MPRPKGIHLVEELESVRPREDDERAMKKNQTEKQDVFSRAIELLGEKGIVKEVDFDGQPSSILLFANTENNIMAVVHTQNDTGKEKHGTFSLFRSGILSATDSEFKHVGIAREELEGKIFEILESLKINFWFDTESNIVVEGAATPSGDGQDGDGPEGRPEPETSTDIRKIDFFQNHPEALFGAYSKLEGIGGYRAVFFKNFVVLESPDYGNATYILDIRHDIDRDKIEQLADKEKRRRIKPAERKKIIGAILDQTEIQVIFNSSKGELMNRSGEKWRFNHKSQDQFEQWRGRMEQVIAKISEQLAEEPVEVAA